MNRYPFWRVHPRLTTMLVVALLLAAAGAGTYVHVQSSPVYVTDGSHYFSNDLRIVEDQIRRENEQVRSSGKPYVSIAFADEMDPVLGVDPLTRIAVRHDLEGAYLAQLAWNRPIGKAPTPLIQLLLVNEGSREAMWYSAAKAVEGLVSGPDHLVAVTGLGISIENTRNLIAELAAHQIALVAGAVTGDNMTLSVGSSNPVPGIVRVAPTNSDEAAAVVHHLDGDAHVPEHPTVMLVQDQYEQDVYAASLGAAFMKALEADTTRKYTFIPDGMTFNAGLADAGLILGASADRVCSAHADVLYFAGRSVDLEGFLSGLAGRSCAADRPLAILSGPDLARLAGHHLWNSPRANMTVLYTGVAHPDMWSHSPSAASPEIVQRFNASCGTCFPALFPGESLNDADAIMAHDAVWTAARAIQKAGATENAPIPSASSVAQALPLLGNVDAASGWICSFDGNHNPVNKAVPVVSIDQNGELAYEKLSSSTGTPPISTCPS